VWVIELQQLRSVHSPFPRNCLVGSTSGLPKSNQHVSPANYGDVSLPTTSSSFSNFSPYKILTLCVIFGRRSAAMTTKHCHIVAKQTSSSQDRTSYLSSLDSTIITVLYTRSTTMAHSIHATDLEGARAACHPKAQSHHQPLLVDKLGSESR
jgi:hypothetical protein